MLATVDVTLGKKGSDRRGDDLQVQGSGPQVCSFLLWGTQLKLPNDNQYYDPSFFVDLPIAWGKLYCRREGEV